MVSGCEAAVNAGNLLERVNNLIDKLSTIVALDDLGESEVGEDLWRCKKITSEI